MHEVLEEVDSDVVTIRDVRLHVHCEKLVDLPLGAELGTECCGCYCWSVLCTCLHPNKLLDFQL